MARLLSLSLPALLLGSALGTAPPARVAEPPADARARAVGTSRGSVPGPGAGRRPEPPPRAGEPRPSVPGGSWDDGWGVIITGPCAMAGIWGDLPDSDGDGLPDACDTCPHDPDPSDADWDGDGIGDACDTCPGVVEPTNSDLDGDGIGDACDTCPRVPDPSNADSDGDGIGDACDG